MNFCPNLQESTQIFGHILGQWNTSLSGLESCGSPTYLRPSGGSALPPYIFIILEFLVHVPTCFLRFAEHEKVQTWSIILAAFNIAITTLSYISTGLAPTQVTTWQPLVLTLDFGAMLLIAILLLKDIGWHRFTHQIRTWAWKPIEIILNSFKNDPQTAYEMSSTIVPEADLNSEHEEADLDPEHGAEADITETLDSQGKGKVAAKTVGAALALLWLLWIAVLQVVGLSYAVNGSKVRDLTARWCSPDFQPGVIALIDGNCNVRKIADSHDFNRGIACVELPATQQITWLTNTVVIVSISLGVQFFDAVTMIMSHGNSAACLQMINPRRPWLTTIAGLFIYIVLASGGIELANHLPDGITQRVLVLRFERSLGVFPVCASRLLSPGLRGAVIGYTDGLFNSWGSAFYGLNTTAVGAIASRGIHFLPEI